MLDKLRTANNWLDYQLSRRLRWPEEVYINFTSECNKQCEFCTYDHKIFKDAQRLRLNDIKKMTWIKYAKFLGLWCGNGESLMNPEFEVILDYIRATWPHLKTHLSTNGILLNSRIGNKITFINVSLNTSKVSPIVISTMCQIRTTKIVSFIMTLNNIHELPVFVRLAGGMNATAVIGHCMFHSWSRQRPLNNDKSCYNDPEKTNHYLKKANDEAQKWGVTLWAPPLIGQESYICRGTPIHHNLPYCSDPFKRIYLTVDEYAQPSMVVCCSGCYFDVRYDITKMTPEYFKEKWNNHQFKYLRRTANKPSHGGNLLCAWCKNVNRFKPEATVSYERVKKAVRTGEWIK